jgi:hypothetical protein
VPTARTHAPVPARARVWRAVQVARLVARPPAVDLSPTLPEALRAPRDAALAGLCSPDTLEAARTLPAFPNPDHAATHAWTLAALQRCAGDRPAARATLERLADHHPAWAPLALWVLHALGAPARTLPVEHGGQGAHLQWSRADAWDDQARDWADRVLAHQPVRWLRTRLVDRRLREPAHRTDPEALRHRLLRARSIQAPDALDRLLRSSERDWEDLPGAAQAALMEHALRVLAGDLARAGARHRPAARERLRRLEQTLAEGPYGEAWSRWLPWMTALAADDPTTPSPSFPPDQTLPPVLGGSAPGDPAEATLALLYLGHLRATHQDEQAWRLAEAWAGHADPWRLLPPQPVLDACFQLAPRGTVDLHGVCLAQLLTTSTEDPALAPAWAARSLARALAQGGDAEARRWCRQTDTLRWRGSTPMPFMAPVHYWCARADDLEGTGAPGEARAMAAWDAIRRAVPLSWYGVMAEAWWVRRGGAPRWSAWVSSWQRGSATERLPADPVGAPGAHAWRAGFAGTARQAWAYQAQLFGPMHPSTTAWAVVSAWSTGDLQTAIWTTRHRLQPAHHTAHALHALAPTLLHAGWPMAWRKEVRQAAAFAGVEEAWLLAVMRRESAMEPQARSAAGARGLMQLLPGTAREMRARLQPGSMPDPRAWHEPGPSLVLGARALALWRHGGCMEPAIAAYSAGPARSRAWLEAAPGLESDLWTELVPLSTVRAYLREVVVSRAIYRWQLGLPWADPLCSLPALVNPPGP